MFRRDRENPIAEAPGLRVVYLSGASRSGSTVLASLLGSQPDSVSVGELIQLHRYGWLQDDYCACGARCSRCPFWNGVCAEWRHRCPGVEVAAYLKLQSRFERLRGWPRLRIESALGTIAFNDYAQQTRALLQAICAVSGKRVVIDSSKRPVRAAALSLIEGLDVRLLHLVRDVRATAWSQAKSYRKDPRNGVPTEKRPQPIQRSTRDWLLAHVLAARFGPARADLRLLVRYEDLVHHPEQTLMRLQSFLQLDLRHVIDRVLCGDAFPVGHQVAGNRLRMQGAVRLRSDVEWIHAMPAADRDVCWRLAGWLARRYGYARDVSDIADVAKDKAPPCAPAQPHFRTSLQVGPPESRVPCSNG